MRRINFDELDSAGSLEYLLAGELFTGEVVETDRSGRLLSLIKVVKGDPDGLTTIWYPDGTKKLQETIKNGRPVGVAQRWHVNGVLAEEKTFDEQGRRVATVTWDEAGQRIEPGPGTESGFR